MTPYVSGISRALLKLSSPTLTPVRVRSVYEIFTLGSIKLDPWFSVARVVEIGVAGGAIVVSRMGDRGGLVGIPRNPECV